MSQLHHEPSEFDVCVIGGGMAGLCAAIAAARRGAKTAIVQDRPVFGGNASSEVRMWICGAHGPQNKETGLLEEIQLENQYRNPTSHYSIWDSVLYGKVCFQPNLTTFLNCACTDAVLDGHRIMAVKAWQLTSQTWHTIYARQFIDCSGDSLLAAVTGAEFRMGREARSEFDEDIQPAVADRKTMGNTLLIQFRQTAEPEPFIAPAWAYKFAAADLKHRVSGVSGHNFWWLEIGGLQDTIRAAEPIRDELMKIAYGVWDYLKNRAPERAQAENLALEWIGSLPGKRESRRYIGDHILTQNDIRAGGKFPDQVAYGGWSMDDHHPAGLLYPGAPTIFHPAPSPYGIPYRSLYSRNIANLLFAGRNISVTHAALSSTRVMGTCAILGQAAGTAAALCIQNKTDPRGVNHQQLQHALMDDDCWLPGQTRSIANLALTGNLTGVGPNLTRLHDGVDRDRPDQEHAWSGPLGSTLEYRWNDRQQIAGIRAVFDSNLQNPKRMAYCYPAKQSVPGTLVKTFRIEACRDGGKWEIVHRETGNYQRLVRLPLQLVTTGLRIVIEETWGDASTRVFACEPVATIDAPIPRYPNGAPFHEVRAKVAAGDLAAPPCPGNDNKSRFSA